MAQRLSDIRPGDNHLGEGVSLVHRGANRRRFLLAKSGDVEVDETIAKILDEPAGNEGAVLDAVRKAGGDDEVLLAASAFARIRESLPAEVLKAMRDQMDDDMDDDDLQDGDLSDDDIEKAVGREGVFKADFSAAERRQMAKTGVAMPDGSYPIPDRAHLEKAIRAVGRGNAPHAEIRAHIAKRARALGATDLLPDSWNVTKEDRMSETAVPVKKEDGSYDLSAIPEDARGTVEAVLKERDERDAELIELRKQAEENESKAAEAIEIAKAERDARETREFVEKSQSLANIAKSDDEFGEVLKSIYRAEQDKHLPDGTAAKLDEVLKAADEQIAKGGLFDELGSGNSGAKSDAAAKLDAAAAELRKADPKLTEAQAVSKALDNDPSLYTELKKEQV